MSFLARHEEIMKKVKPVSPFRMWLNTVLFSWLIFGLCLGYLYLRNQKLTTFYVNQAAAETAVFLIGFSFLLSSICYFFNFLDTKIIYRKHLGVIGFTYGLAHIIFVVIVLSAQFPFANWFTSEALVAGLGLLAALLFTGMTAISNRYVIAHIGGLRWRAALRYGGYTALLLVWFHIIATSWVRWLSWISAPKGLPAISLVSSVFIIFVFAARFTLALSLWRESRKKIA
jgi:hypothetical protein